jgi:hypothetical protein
MVWYVVRGRQVILLKNMTVTIPVQRGNQFQREVVALVNGQRGCVTGFERKHKEDMPKVVAAHCENLDAHILRPPPPPPPTPQLPVFHSQVELDVACVVPSGKVRQWS